MSLYGILGFVPLDEVLRLLLRSRREGAVHVRGEALGGRIFFGPEGIVFATTTDDDSTARQLVRARVVDEGAIRSVVSGEASLSTVAEPTSLDAFIRETTVESLYQMSRLGADFNVYQGETTGFASSSPLELEQLVEAVSARADEWREVTKLVPDLSATLHFERDLGDRREVKIGAEEWVVISEIGAGSSVEGLADRLGTTRFAAARIAARLIEDSLLEVEGGDAQPPQVGDGEWESEIQETAGRSNGQSPDDTWWLAPADEEPVTDELHSMFEGLPAAGADSRAEQGVAGGGDEPTRVEEDTEAFLEKVFSELESARRSRTSSDAPLAHDPMGRAHDA